jgi:hypothetical protein
MHDAAREIGGFFMKSHAAEDLFDASWTVVMLWSKEVFGEDRSLAALELPTSSLTYAEFEQIYAFRQIFSRLQKTYSLQSATSLSLIATVIEIFRLVLEQEINRPYTGWYNDELTESEPPELRSLEMTLRAAIDYATTKGIQGVSPARVPTIVDALHELSKGIGTYRIFLGRQRRRQLLGKLLAV